VIKKKLNNQTFKNISKLMQKPLTKDERKKNKKRREFLLEIVGLSPSLDFICDKVGIVQRIEPRRERQEPYEEEKPRISKV
jgi:hypothetical protein